MTTALPARRALRIAALTALAMLAFAANSLLCRMALGHQLIDPASFASVRICAGAALLWGLLALRREPRPDLRPSWPSALALFVYMAGFSFAYVSLGVGAGALILFGTVQITMFAAALRAGERFSALSWLGLAAAFGGIAYLVWPGVRAPDPFGAVLMAIAGAAWGAYSLLGRGARDPLASTALNFLWCVPLTAAMSLLFIAQAHASAAGIALAIVSGAIASGVGYAIWYAALRGLRATQASIVQLSVPVIAALGGVALLHEPLTARLGLASIVTLGGVALVLMQRGASAPPVSAAR